MAHLQLRKKVTIKDVAAKAGVCHSTVSLVFSRSPLISEKTREKVLAVAKTMNYVPNLGARNLRRGYSNILGFVVNDISNPFYGTMLQTAETIALERGYEMIIADTQWNPDREMAAIEKMISFQAKGLFLCSTEQTSLSFKKLNNLNGPTTVAVDTCPPTYRGCFIGNDTAAAGEMAAKHLLEIGCRNPVFFSARESLKSFSCFMELETGFLKVLKENGIEKKPEQVYYAGLSYEDGKQAFHKIRQISKTVDGIFCANDLCALGVMNAADASEVRIGRDLALVGVDDNIVSQSSRISLTSIRQPIEQIIRMAVEVLLESFENNTIPKLRKAFRPELIVRQSSQFKKHIERPRLQLT